MTVLISNSLPQVIVAQYRMPGRVDGSPHPVLSKVIQPRALLNEVSFPDNEHFEEWKRQNKSLIESGILILGKTSESNVMKTNENISNETVKRTSKRTDEEIGKIEESAKQMKTKIKTEVVKA